MDYSADGYCGLYCGACPMFLGSRAGAEKNPCLGCKSRTVSGWCLTCDIKACARNKGLEFCYPCEKYPCEKMEGFKNAKEYPYHQEVYDYLETIKKEGKAAWLASMRTRWSCPSCHREASWWDLSCKNCGSKLDGYSKP